MQYVNHGPQQWKGQRTPWPETLPRRVAICFVRSCCHAFASLFGCPMQEQLWTFMVSRDTKARRRRPNPNR
jgi:hypothetical protein